MIQRAASMRMSSLHITGRYQRSFCISSLRRYPARRMSSWRSRIGDAFGILSNNSSPTDDSKKEPLLEEKPAGPSLEEALRSQDPYGRIRFLECHSATVDLANRHARFNFGRRGTGHNVEAYCVPFWTTMALFDVEWGLLERRTGRNATSKSFRAHCSFTVSAVDETHWCHNMVLTDDCRFIGAMTMNDLIHDNPLDYTNGLFPLLDESTWKPTMSPKFAKGYPKLYDDDWAFLVRQGFLNQSKELRANGRDDIVPMVNVSNTVTYAIPTYRIVFKVPLKNGDIGFQDGADQDAFFEIQAGNGPHIDVKRLASMLDGHAFAYWSPALGANGVRSDDMKWTPIAAGMEQPLQVAQRIIDRMPYRVNWKDPQILTGDNHLNGATSQDLLLYAYLRSTHSEMIRSAPGTAIPDMPDQSKPLFPPRSPVKLLPARRATQRFTRPADPEVKLRLPPLQPSPSAGIPKVKPTIRQRPTAPVRIADPKGFYKILGVVPDSSYLEPAKEVETTRHLKDAQLALNIIYHPDKNRNKQTAGADRYTGITAEINQAFENLETLVKRVKYNQMSI